MYVEGCLARQRDQERLKRAREARSAHQVAELRKLEKRQQRAERELLHAWELVERLRSVLGAA
jgi:hypothetical protein